METTNTETAADTEPSVAAIILGQINALDFWARARWGWKQSVRMSDTALMLNCNRGVKIIVTLDPSDTYSVQVGRYNSRTLRTVIKGEASDVYAEDLVSIIDRLFADAFGGL
jgi:hypothetical protein